MDFSLFEVCCAPHLPPISLAEEHGTLDPEPFVEVYPDPYGHPDGLLTSERDRWSKPRDARSFETLFLRRQHQTIFHTCFLARVR
jgi:hypothetical protein